jgi:hypothetical protein
VLGGTGTRMDSVKDNAKRNTLLCMENIVWIPPTDMLFLLFHTTRNLVYVCQCTILSEDFKPFDAYARGKPSAGSEVPDRRNRIRLSFYGRGVPDT